MLDRMTIAYDKEENKFIEANKDNILGLAIVYYRYNYLNFDRLKVKFELPEECTVIFRAVSQSRMVALEQPLCSR